MIRRVRALALFGAALFAPCCAPAPPARFTDYAAIPPGQARLYVYRPARAAGPHDAGGVTLDSRPLVALDKGEYVSVVLEPGPHVLAAGVSEVSRLARLPSRTVALRADRATFCSLSAEAAGPLVVWDLHCSGDAEVHAELRACRRGKLDRTVDWQP
jgi:hypothetical protein